MEKKLLGNCPVCGGSGKINEVKIIGNVSKLAYVSCTSCKGTGIINIEGNVNSINNQVKEVYGDNKVLGTTLLCD